jgi:hypothetical protein
MPETASPAPASPQDAEIAAALGVGIAETGCDAENLARQFLNLALDCGGRDASGPDGAARRKQCSARFVHELLEIVVHRSVVE